MDQFQKNYIKAEFHRTYLAWVKATAVLDRENKWIEYTIARDVYMGFSHHIYKFNNLIDN